MTRRVAFGHNGDGRATLCAAHREAIALLLPVTARLTVVGGKPADLCDFCDLNPRRSL